MPRHTSPAGKVSKAMSKSDPTLAGGKLAKRVSAVKRGAEGPKRSVKGPVTGKSGGKGVPAYKPPVPAKKASSYKSPFKTVKKMVKKGR